MGVTFQPAEVDGHVALDALAVLLGGLSAHHGGVVLRQPISHLALRGHHSHLKGAQVAPAPPAAPRAALLGAGGAGVVRRAPGHVVFDGHLPRGGAVELYGEGGVALSCGAEVVIGQVVCANVMDAYELYD